MKNNFYRYTSNNGPYTNVSRRRTVENNFATAMRDGYIIYIILRIDNINYILCTVVVYVVRSRFMRLYTHAAHLSARAVNIRRRGLCSKTTTVRAFNCFSGLINSSR